MELPWSFAYVRPIVWLTAAGEILLISPSILCSGWVKVFENERLQFPFIETVEEVDTPPPQEKNPDLYIRKCAQSFITVTVR